MAPPKKPRPVHPGEVLREEYLIPLGMDATALADALNIPVERVRDIARETQPITADVALRLARYFRSDARSWMNMQVAHDLEVAELTHGRAIRAAVTPRRAAA